MQEVGSGSFSAEQRIEAEAQTFFADKRSYDTNFQNEECSAIYHTAHCKHCANALYSRNCQDSRDIVFSSGARDCYSVIWGRNIERCYQVVGGSDAYDCAFCDGVIGGARSQRYCFCCHNGCRDLFGCFFLKAKGHCILNKQYSPSEYNALLPRIYNHMQSTGELDEWFPKSLYSVPYEESWARYFLTELNEEQIRRRGLMPSAAARRHPDASGITVPDEIDNFTEALCNKEIVCAASGQRYSIGLQELKALRKQRCPIPHQRWSVVLTEMQATSIRRCHREIGLSFV